MMNSSAPKKVTTVSSPATPSTQEEKALLNFLWKESQEEMDTGLMVLERELKKTKQKTELLTLQLRNRESQHDIELEYHETRLNLAENEAATLRTKCREWKERYST